MLRNFDWVGLASPQGHRYIVSGTTFSQGVEPRGHHMYQLHPYAPVSTAQLATLCTLLTVTFVRRNQFTVWPYPFNLLRLHQEMALPPTKKLFELNSGHERCGTTAQAKSL